MNRANRISSLLAITDCEQFCLEFYDYLLDKPSSQNELEKAAYLLLSMLPDIEMEGFADLFYQLYSLKDCAMVEQYLRQLGLNQLADLFKEAKVIYTRGNVQLTPEEYKQLDPFTLEEAQGRRFDEIHETIMVEGGEIYLIEERICQYIKTNAHLLLAS